MDGGMIPGRAPQAAPASPVQITQTRIGYHRNGYKPVPITDPDAPVKNPGKQPVLKDWRRVCSHRDRNGSILSVIDQQARVGRPTGQPGPKHRPLVRQSCRRGHRCADRKTRDRSSGTGRTSLRREASGPLRRETEDAAAMADRDATEKVPNEIATAGRWHGMPDRSSGGGPAVRRRRHTSEDEAPLLLGKRHAVNRPGQCSARSNGTISVARVPEPTRRRCYGRRVAEPRRSAMRAHAMPPAPPVALPAVRRRGHGIGPVGVALRPIAPVRAISSATSTRPR